jgi:UbiA prenyltransferase family
MQQTSLAARLFQYQKERFPLLKYAILVSVFTFSAISFSQALRGAPGFISFFDYAIGASMCLSLFALLRVSDEFKDAVDDAKFRPDLPVPRGLVSLAELGRVAWAIFGIEAALLLIFHPKMTLLWAIVLGWLALMRVEFFAVEWLRKHHFWYVASHMAIMPFVDFYASGLDWRLAGAGAAAGLWFFYAVSYFNGLVLEIGRKIRRPEDEREGVDTYSAMFGAKKAVQIWWACLLVTAALACAAIRYVNYPNWTLILLAIMLIISVLCGFLFLKNKTVATAKRVEDVAGLWTMMMYLLLGLGHYL